jgi:4-diphosphocytidyl-2-C-methyl-D-erythritol kinase
LAKGEFAPAKVNLYLHVGARRGDGYHPLHSLMVFADLGDEVRLEPAAAMELAMAGPFAGELQGPGDNLVIRARDAFLAGRPAAPFRLVLDKRLPVAAGLGGGSSDAAATLRLLARELELDGAPLAELAARLGSDTPACLAARPVLASGRGEILIDPPSLPDLPAVLVNPGVGLSTGAVFDAYDEAPDARGGAAPRWPSSVRTPAEAGAFLAGCRNDLQAPAARLQPAIAQVLDALAVQAGCLLARMSGSGATCFGLWPDADAARAAAERLRRREPRWWVAQTTLAGAAPGAMRQSKFGAGWQP